MKISMKKNILAQAMLEVNNSATLEEVAIGAAVWTDKDYVFTSLPQAFLVCGM